MKATVKYCVSPTGSITPVSSKSLSNRALIIHALTGFGCHITHLSASDDTRILCRLLEQYRTAGGSVTLDAGMAGTVMRFMATFCCLGDKEVLLTGNERMLQRPMKELVEVLKKTGADIHYTGREGFAPLHIRPASIRGGSLTMDAGVSSQFVTSLMLCAPYFENGLELELSGRPVSYSYVLLTKQLMEHFGAQVSIGNGKICVKKKKYEAGHYRVEGDWSSAAYFYSLAVLSESCEIELKQMNIHSLQGDKVMVEMAQRFGVETRISNDGVLLGKKKIIAPAAFAEDFLLCPDLAPTVAVMCAGLGLEKATLEGLSTLRGKETDRITALENELKRMGVRFYCTEDDLFSFDARALTAPATPVRTYNDHRMAMSFAPLAQKTGTITIEDPQVVQKSYPGYWEDLKSLGCLVENSDI